MWVKVIGCFKVLFEWIEKFICSFEQFSPISFIIFHILLRNLKNFLKFRKFPIKVEEVFLNNWKVSVGNSYEIMSWTFIEKESNSAANSWKLIQKRIKIISIPTWEFESFCDSKFERLNSNKQNIYSTIFEIYSKFFIQRQK